MIYIPAERPEFKNDPISAYGDQLLTQWAWDNGHKIFCDGDCQPLKCQCGTALHTDEAIRDHWMSQRSRTS